MFGKRPGGVHCLVALKTSRGVSEIQKKKMDMDQESIDEQLKLRMMKYGRAEVVPKYRI